MFIARRASRINIQEYAYVHPAATRRSFALLVFFAFFEFVRAQENVYVALFFELVLGGRRINLQRDSISIFFFFFEASCSFFCLVLSSYMRVRRKDYSIDTMIVRILFYFF